MSERSTLQRGDRVRVTSEHAPGTDGMTGTVRKGTGGDWGWAVGVELDGLYGVTWYTPDELTKEAGK